MILHEAMAIRRIEDIQVSWKQLEYFNTWIKYLQCRRVPHQRGRETPHGLLLLLLHLAVCSSSSSLFSVRSTLPMSKMTIPVFA